MNVLAEIERWPTDNAVCIVVGDDGEILGSHGDSHRPYALASVTKLLSSYAFLIAIEEEAISLDDAAGPEGSTVRHLLAHTGGYDFDSKKIRFRPGAKRGYSNTGFDVLAEHLENESGISLQDYVSESVFEPLGMSNTTINGSCAKDGWSTAADLALFAAEVLKPRLLSPATLDNATKVHFDGVDGLVPGFGRHSPNDWGLGFEIRGRKNPHWTGSNQPPNTVGHFGQSGTYMWIEADQFACITLTDKNFGNWATELWPEFNSAVHDKYSTSNSK